MPFISSVRGSYGAQGRFGRALAANFFGSGADGAAVISSNTNLTVLNKIGSYDGDINEYRIEGESYYVARYN